MANLTVAQKSALAKLHDARAKAIEQWKQENDGQWRVGVEPQPAGSQRLAAAGKAVPLVHDHSELFGDKLGTLDVDAIILLAENIHTKLRALYEDEDKALKSAVPPAAAPKGRSAAPGKRAAPPGKTSATRTASDDSPVRRTPQGLTVPILTAAERDDATRRLGRPLTGNETERLGGLYESLAEAMTDFGAHSRSLTGRPSSPTAAELAEQARLGDCIDSAQRAVTTFFTNPSEPEKAEPNSMSTSTPDVHVKSEPRTYCREGRNSFFADHVLKQMPHDPRSQEAAERLAAHGNEVAHEARLGTKEGLRARRCIREMTRSNNPRKADEERALYGAAYGSENRAGMTTGSSSGGSFVTPEYLTSQYAIFRQPGRAFIDQCRRLPLPEYGLTVNLPALTSSAAVATQTTQNSGVSETDPSAEYLTTSLQTFAGQVNASQQLLDRGGPDGSFDTIIYEQLKAEYDVQVDTYAITTALANAQTVTYNGSFAISTLYSKVGGAKSLISTTAGTYLPASHVFFEPARWDYTSVQVDSNGRPLVVPNYANPYNAVAAGSDGAPLDPSGGDGDTGFRFVGLRVFQDLNIPAPSSGSDQVVVANMGNIFAFENDAPLVRVLPQTNASTLTVLIQLMAYAAVLPRYPSGIATVTGTSLGSISF